MHIPKKFEQQDPDQLAGIIREYPFANLVTHSDSGLNVNHVPFVLDQSDGKQLLKGHIARVNPLWKNVDNHSEVLVVFNGPNCYVSPNYYPTKKEHGKAVPTWNYITVHVKGNMSFIHDERWNLDMLNSLTSQYEAGRPDPWSVTDAPEVYTQRMIRGIVGLEIAVSSITGQWKVSQNQPDENIQGVIGGLSQESNSDAQKIAELVKRHALKAN